jgi:hypothetical protein
MVDGLYCGSQSDTRRETVKFGHKRLTVATVCSDEPIPVTARPRRCSKRSRTCWQRRLGTQWAGSRNHGDRITVPRLFVNLSNHFSSVSYPAGRKSRAAPRSAASAWAIRFTGPGSLVRPRTTTAAEAAACLRHREGGRAGPRGGRSHALGGAYAVGAGTWLYQPRALTRYYEGPSLGCVSRSRRYPTGNVAKRCRESLGGSPGRHIGDQAPVAV